MKKVLFLSYSLFLLSLTFFSYLFIDPNLNYLKNLYSEFIFNHRIETTLIYSLLIIIFFIFYGIFIKQTIDNKFTKKDIKFLLIITGIILFLAYPAMLSFDIFNYILTAKVAYFYHENPYVVMPVQLAREPLLAFAHGANKIALYGPTWILFTALPYFLGFGNFIITLFSFKIVSVVFYFLTSWLIFKITKNILSVVIFALNPLVAIEVLLSGHNDIFMMFLAISALFFLSKKKIFLSFIILFMSIFVKYATLFLLPIFSYVLVSYLNKKYVNWNKVYLLSSVAMIVPFFLAPIREEIYPWYALWFLTFSCLLPKNKNLLILSGVFSFSLLLRYIPFMLLGTYFSPTPFIKIVVTFVPPVVALVYIFISEKLWLKKSYL